MYDIEIVYRIRIDAADDDQAKAFARIIHTGIAGGKDKKEFKVRIRKAAQNQSQE